LIIGLPHQSRQPEAPIRVLLALLRIGIEREFWVILRLNLFARGERLQWDRPAAYGKRLGKGPGSIFFIMPADGVTDISYGIQRFA
jgi:hypothetical protein